MGGRHRRLDMIFDAAGKLTALYRAAQIRTQYQEKSERC